MRKEQVMTKSEILFQHLRGESPENNEQLQAADVLVEIRTGYLPTTEQKH
jgi:hypothetical protein